MSSYYTATLYPLQDKVLKIIQDIATPFYLTGGTALSRGYFHHRYSNDLDFFVNQNKDFVSLSEKFLQSLVNQKIQVVTRSDSYYSFKVADILKIDLINDSGQHYGDLQTTQLFFRLDNPENILANKITAVLSRDEPKDIVDIWIIATKTSVNWPQIFTAANSKAVGIFPPAIAQKIAEFPLELLQQIKWVENQEPTVSQFEDDIKKIVNDILALK